MAAAWDLSFRLNSRLHQVVNRGVCMTEFSHAYRISMLETAGNQPLSNCPMRPVRIAR